MQSPEYRTYPFACILNCKTQLILALILTQYLCVYILWWLCNFRKFSIVRRSYMCDGLRVNIWCCLGNDSAITRKLFVCCTLIYYMQYSRSVHSLWTTSACIFSLVYILYMSTFGSIHAQRTPLHTQWLPYSTIWWHMLQCRLQQCFHHTGSITRQVKMTQQLTPEVVMSWWHWVPCKAFMWRVHAVSYYWLTMGTRVYASKKKTHGISESC